MLEATFTSVADMVGESTWGFLPVSLILTQKFDALAKIAEVKVPVLITHGTRDSIVPFNMGERLYQAATAKKRSSGARRGPPNISGAAFDEYRRPYRAFGCVGRAVTPFVGRQLRAARERSRRLLECADAEPRSAVLERP